MSRTVSRRTILRGAGASLALPWLEVTNARAEAEKLSEPPMRMLYIYWDPGTRPDFWTPPGDAESFTLDHSPHLQPFAGLKDDFILVENLWNEQAQGRNGHWPKIPCWLTGGRVERTAGDDLNCGAAISADQLVAQTLGGLTPLPSLELGIDAPRTGIDTAGGGFARMYGSMLSWRDQRTPVLKEIVPQLAYDRLFRNNRTKVVSSLNPNDPAILNALQRDDASVLDLVLDQRRAIQRDGSASDKVRLDEYFESVRSVEQRLDASLRPQKRWINAGSFPLDRPVAGIPASHAEHVKLMLDILALAVWSDTTRVGTFMLGDAQTQQDYAFLTGISGGFHSISHHDEDPVKRGQYEKIVTWQCEQAAYFLNKLKNMDEGGRSLLDSSMVLVGGSLKDGNRHTEEDLPLLLAGKAKGTLRPGRRVRAAARTPMCNLHLAMLNRMGIAQKSFGDSTGPLKNLI